jgi:hypothetical protein
VSDQLIAHGAGLHWFTWAGAAGLHRRISFDLCRWLSYKFKVGRVVAGLAQPAPGLRSGIDMLKMCTRLLSACEGSCRLR